MKEQIAKLIGILLMSRTASHLSHWKTSSYAKHKALHKFYEDVVDVVDDLAEVAQGKFGKLDIPYVEMKGNIEKPVEMLEMHLTMVENLGKKCEVGTLKNIVDEIQALYLKTIYLMKELD